MKIQSIILCSLVLLCASASAQQDPDDPGAADTVKFICDSPDLYSGKLAFKLDLLFYHDVDILRAASLGIEWDNAKVILDSAIVDPAAKTAFGGCSSMWEPPCFSLVPAEIERANQLRTIGASGFTITDIGLSPDPTGPQLIVTYWFHAENWQQSDTVTFDTAAFSSFSRLSFLGSSRNDYTPVFAGAVTIRDASALCCSGLRGNVDCSASDTPDIGDLSALIDHLFISYGPVCCYGEASMDNQAGVDIGDLTALVNFLFISNVPPPSCE